MLLYITDFPKLDHIGRFLKERKKKDWKEMEKKFI